MTIIPLSEGSFTVDRTKVFAPFDAEKDVLEERPVGSLLVEVQPFLVITSKDILLLDAGLGFRNGEGVLQVHENIKAAGYDPAQVTKVLMTHLHKDHAGGIGSPHSDVMNGTEVLSFPQARHYVQSRELDFAWKTGAPSFPTDEIKPLIGSESVVFLHEDAGTIDEYISYQLTGGHSPFHQVFWIRDEGEVVFFGGDVAPQLQQMKIRYKTRYDFDPQRAMELRQEWWTRGAAERWKFLFYHDIKTPFFQAG